MGTGIILKIRQEKKYKHTIASLDDTPVYKNRRLVLTKEQIQEAKQYWAPYFKLRKRDLLAIDCFTKLNNKFSPAYISPHIFYRRIIPAINNVPFAESMQNKAYFNRTVPNLKHPNTIFMKINGVFYDNDLHMIGMNFPGNLLKENIDYIYKPGEGTCSGHGIFKFNKSEVKDHSKDFDQYEYLIQEIIKPCKELAKYSPILSTLRIFTLFYKGNVSVLNVIYRLGDYKRGIVDNWTHGGYAIPFDKNLKPRDFSYDGKLSHNIDSFTDTEGNVVQYKDIVVPKLDEMIKLAIESAKAFPQIMFIGWDFALDENKNIISIEANMSHSDIGFLQMRSIYDEPLGPAMKDILKEVFKDYHY